MSPPFLTAQARDSRESAGVLMMTARGSGPAFVPTASRPCLTGTLALLIPPVLSEIAQNVISLNVAVA